MFDGYESLVAGGILALIAAVGRQITKEQLFNMAGSPNDGYDEDADEDQPQ